MRASVSLQTIAWCHERGIAILHADLLSLGIQTSMESLNLLHSSGLRIML